MSAEKLTDAEMRLFCLGAALYGANREGARIIADALDEMTRSRKQAVKKPSKRRRKK